MIELMRSAAPPLADATRSRILDVAERLVQTRGFNGFSYADIAVEVGITRASLHYHFATKAELGRRLIARYSEQFAQALQSITAQLPAAAARLRAYVKLYTDVLTDERMCLCGMVAAEYSTLPAPMQSALRVFFEINESWLAELLEQGSHEGTPRAARRAADVARMLVGALEGEMLVARAYGDPARFIGGRAAGRAARWRPRTRRGSPRVRAAGAASRLRAARRAAGRPHRVLAPDAWLTPLFVLALIAGTALELWLSARQAGAVARHRDRGARAVRRQRHGGRARQGGRLHPRRSCASAASAPSWTPALTRR